MITATRLALVFCLLFLRDVLAQEGDVTERVGTFKKWRHLSHDAMGRGTLSKDEDGGVGGDAAAARDSRGSGFMSTTDTAELSAAPVHAVRYSDEELRGELLVQTLTDSDFSKDTFKGKMLVAYFNKVRPQVLGILAFALIVCLLLRRNGHRSSPGDQ
jgi:hypothetical protein